MPYTVYAAAMQMLLPALLCIHQFINFPKHEVHTFFYVHTIFSRNPAGMTQALRRRPHYPAAYSLCRGYAEDAAIFIVSNSISTFSKIRGAHIFLCVHHLSRNPSGITSDSTQTPPTSSGRIHSMSRLSRGCCHHVHLHSEIFKKARCTHFFLCAHHSIQQPSRHNTSLAMPQTPPTSSGRIRSAIFTTSFIHIFIVYIVVYT